MNYYKENCLLILMVSLVGFFFTSCATKTEITKLKLEGKWSLVGLDTLWVHTLKEYDNKLYAGTSNGVYYINGNEFEHRGLKKKTVLDIERVSEGEFLAIVVRTQEDRRSIFRSTDNETSWVSNMGNFGGEENHTAATDMIVFADDPNHLMVKGSENIAESFDKGQTWENVFLDWNTYVSSPDFIELNPYNSNVIWAGGANAYFAPSVQRSLDGGKTWDNIDFSFSFGGRTAMDVIFNKKSDKKVLLAFQGIAYSSDSGDTWELTYNETGVITFTRSITNQDVIFGSGINSQGTLYFIASQDFGKTWQSVSFPDGPTGLFIKDIISILNNGKEELFFATNTGIYNYSFETDL